MAIRGRADAHGMKGLRPSGFKSVNAGINWKRKADPSLWISNVGMPDDACGNAVAAIDVDFRTRVNGNSRSPHC